MNKRLFFLLIISVLVLNAFSACSLAKTNVISAPPPTQAVPTQPAPVEIPAVTGDLLAAYQGTLENLYTNVSPSVVNIRVIHKTQAANITFPELPGFPFFSFPQGQQPEEQYQKALGSGFVWDNEGYIVTNNHVVSGADKIEVTFSDGTIVSAALVGADPDSDLAVIKVDPGSTTLRPVKMGNSTTVRVGELAIAIGNPFGLQGTMTTGIISALGRSLPADKNAAQTFTIPDVIQTDAPINPGNSGGVLVDVNGEVIGVTSAIKSPVRANAGIGFAIPSTIVQKIIPSLIKDGKYEHAWLGISGVTLVPDLATAMNLDAQQHGALVEEVVLNSSASKSGLRGSKEKVTINGQSVSVGGDVIIAIDGQTVSGMDDLISYLANHTEVGQKVTLTILRDGKETTLKVKLGARPAENLRTDAGHGIRLGVSVVTLNGAINQAMNLSAGQTGVLVEEVQPGSLAEFAGLQAGKDEKVIDGHKIYLGGDIITEVNGQTVSNVEDLKAVLGQLHRGDALDIAVLRDGHQIRISIQAGQ